MSTFFWTLDSGVGTSISVHAALTTVAVDSPNSQDWVINAGSTATAYGVAIDVGNSAVYTGGTSTDLITVEGTAKTVTVNAGAGADTVFVSGMGTNTTLNPNPTVSVLGGAGIDSITLTNLGTGIFSVDGGDGADTITIVGVQNTGAKVTLKYDITDKVVASDIGVAALTVDASAYSQAIKWDLSTNVSAITLATGSTLSGVAKVIGTQFVDTITSSNANAMTIDGGIGADVLNAGTATTTFVYDAADTKVTGNGAKTTLDASAQTSGVTLHFADQSVFTQIGTFVGGKGADDIRGSNTAITIKGGAGNDAIYGGAGNHNDVLTGQAGADSFWVGAGDGSDTISYDMDTTNTVSYSKDDVINLYDISAFDLMEEGKVTVNNATGDGVIKLGTNTLTLTSAAGKTEAARHFTSAEGWAFDIVFGSTAVTAISGTAGVIDNLIAATGTASTLDGKGGNDNLYGSSAADTFVYHKGDQIYSGGGADTIDATQATDDAQIYMSDLVAGTTLAQSWTITGSRFDDDIRGSALIDTIAGGQGDDSIWGGTGVVNDTLTGGMGADSYWYGLDSGNDTITAGTTKLAGNALDTVNFYDVTGTDALQVSLTGNNLVIGVTGKQGVGTLTLEGWNTADGINKLTNFVVGDAKYTLSLDSTNKAVWTAAV